MVGNHSQEITRNQRLMRGRLFKIWVWLHTKLGLVSHQISGEGAWGWGPLFVDSYDQTFIPAGRYVTLLDKYQIHNMEIWTVDWGGRKIYIHSGKCELLPVKTRIGFRLWML